MLIDLELRVEYELRKRTSLMALDRKSVVDAFLKDLSILKILPPPKDSIRWKDEKYLCCVYVLGTSSNFTRKLETNVIGNNSESVVKKKRLLYIADMSIVKWKHSEKNASTRARMLMHTSPSVQKHATSRDQVGVKRRVPSHSEEMAPAAGVARSPKPYLIWSIQRKLREVRDEILRAHVRESEILAFLQGEAEDGKNIDGVEIPVDDPEAKLAIERRMRIMEEKKLEDIQRECANPQVVNMLATAMIELAEVSRN